jgi:DNA mismatch endonuclease (patch repair protein)
VAVFIDGDFWHGHDFEAWGRNLSAFWYQKIQGNIARDLRNTAALEASGWKVVHIWKHQVKRDLDGCVELIVGAVVARVAAAQARSEAESWPGRAA